MSRWKLKNKWWALLLAPLLLSFFAPGLSKTVYAKDRGGPASQLCNLPQKDGEPSNGSANWASFSFINRTTIKVTFLPADLKCTNIPSQSIQFITGNYELKPYVEGTYVDSDTRDDAWEYSGASHGSHIAYFTNSAKSVMGKNDNPHIDTLSIDELKKFIGSAQLKIRVDEAKIGNACTNDNDFGGKTDDYDLFYDVNKTSWRCRDINDYDATGFKIINAIPDQQSLENFNIAFNFTGTDIVPVESKNTAWKMSECKNVKSTLGTVFGGNSCVPGSHFVNLFASDLATLQTGSSITTQVYKSADDAAHVTSSGETNTITIAGQKSASTTIALTNAGGGPAGSGTQAGAPDCESSGFSLSWIFCPIINGLGNAIDGIYGDFIQPLLITKPLDISNNGTDPNHVFEVWSSFRVLGDIFLVIALLVIVFGQSIGGGLIDAYSAKKILPRLLIAGVLINLSIYLVAFAVDITNVVGNGIGSLIEAPFRNTGTFRLQINGTTSGIGLGALLGGAIWVYAAGSALIPFIFLFILLPAIFIFIAILVTVLLRRGLIILLVMVAPVAFALYCLPNTEQYFKKWWDLLLRTLMVYPIIAAIFATANVLSVTINTAGQTSGIADTLADMLSIIALVVPLALIPFSFRIAGGVLGKASDTLLGFGKRGTEALKGNVNDQRSWRNRARYGLKSRNNELCSMQYSRLSKGAQNARPGGVRSLAYRAAAKGVGYGNLEAGRALMNEEQEKVIAAQYAQGGDNSVRAFWARKYNGTEAEGPANGRAVGAYYSPYQSPDGSHKQWSPADVDKARSIVGRDPSRVQSYAKYEMSKAADDGQLDSFKDRFLEKGKELGWNSNQINEVWAGDKFAHQQTRKEQKYQSIEDEDGKFKWGEIDQHGLSRELVDTMRKGDFASFRSSTGKAAFNGFSEAKSRIGTAAEKPEDKEVVSNYQDLADHLQPSLTGQSGQSEAARRAAQQAAEAAAGSGETVDTLGYGLGASQRAEAEWKKFVAAAARPKSSGSSTPNNGGGGLSTPGSPDFKIPPGSRPGG